MRADPGPAPATAEYGTWPAPISAQMAARHGRRLASLAAAGDTLYWVESPPGEPGRRRLAAAEPGGGVRELLGPGFAVGARVHEYGGRAALLAGSLYFVHFADQRLYRQDGGEPVPLTPAHRMRYAEPILDARRRRLLCVAERHRPGGEPRNLLAAVPIDGDGPPRVLVSDHDFVAAPRLSPDGTELAWLAWERPDMPWDGARLWRAPIAGDGGLGPARQVAGGPAEAAAQPVWGPDGTLYFCSDRRGWWNVFADGPEGPTCLHAAAAEFARPLWMLGDSTLAALDGRTLACSYRCGAEARLALLDTRTGALADLPTPGLTEFSDLATTADGRVAALAAGPAQLPAVITVAPATGRLEVVRESAATPLPEAAISRPQPIAFPTAPASDDPQGERVPTTAYGLYYPPTNPTVTGPPDAAPPLLVRPHGGPTGQAAGTLSLALQFWTARGFAVVEVDYRGSSGYGRTYRSCLAGRWGELDVADCVAGARYLVAQGLADPKRLLIAGGSAGGYTALAALAFTDMFAAGASHYGVSDLESLRAETHKFESRYLDRLVGPYPAARPRYRQRSPLAHAGAVTSPTLFLHGLADRIVPANQAARMVTALKRAGTAVAYLAFDDEAHGLRQAASIQRSLEAELAFYARILGLEPADPPAPLAIANLD